MPKKLQDSLREYPKYFQPAGERNAWKYLQSFASGRHHDYLINISKPNIIIYLADDLGWKDIGFNDAKVVKTPHLDKLASEGIFFKNAFVASPACAPSRAALLTGLMPARNGAENNHTYPKEGINLLTKNLQQNGYKIYGFGKVAHGKMNGECGFDFYHKQSINLEKNIKDFFFKININLSLIHI